MKDLKLELKETEVSQNDFWVQCNVCKTEYKNWTGSTPCCGSIAWLVEEGKPTNKISIFTKVGDGPIAPMEVEFASKK